MSDDIEPEFKINIYEEKNINTNKNYDKYLENTTYRTTSPSLEVENVQAKGTFLLPSNDDLLKFNAENQYAGITNLTQAFQEPSDYFNHIEENNNKISFRPLKAKSDIFGSEFFNFHFENENQKVFIKSFILL